MRYMYNTYHIIHIRMHTIPYILMYVPTTDNIRYDTICIPIYLYTLSLFLVASVASSKSYTSYSRHLFAFASRLSPLASLSSFLVTHFLVSHTRTVPGSYVPILISDGADTIRYNIHTYHTIRLYLCNHTYVHT